MKLGFLADAHGNLEAFRQAVALLRRLGAEELHFLGDAVGYLAGDAVVRAIRDLAMPALRGNHEAMLLAGGVDAGRDAVYRLGETARAMAPELRAFVAGWPTERRVDSESGPLWFVHGSPADPVFGYVYPDSDLAGFRIPAGTIVFMANTHRPFRRECAGARFVNIGSCGLPRDAGCLGSACLFDTVTGEARIVRFDIAAATAAAVARCGTVHPDVTAVFRRPIPDDLFGERHDL